MDIFDRGNKKWTSLMPPEHVAILKGMGIDYHKTDKPLPVEYQLQEIDLKINTALEYRLPVIFELWFDGFEEELGGVIHRVLD